MSVGYLGLGNMGGALAAKLQRTIPLIVHDTDYAAVRRAVDRGSSAAESLADLGRRCDVIFICLPTSTHVRSVIFDEGGLHSSLKPGTIIVDQSTGEPSATRAMADQLREAEVHLVDAPVSGGASGAAAGTIAIMVGASTQDYERLYPLLSAIGDNVFHAGAVGNGHVIKLVNNLLSTVQRLLTFEAMTLAEKNGVDAATALTILLAGGGRNAYMERTLGPKVLEGDLAVGFTLGLAHKDLRLACQLGIESGVPLLLGNVAREMYQMSISEMGSQAQVDAVALVMDRLAGTNVVPADQLRV